MRISLRLVLILMLVFLFPRYLFAVEGGSETPKILVIGDTHAAKIALPLANAFGKDAHVFYNGVAVSPQSKQPKSGADINSILPQIDTWLAKPYDAIFVVFGHENSLKGEDDIKALIKEFPSLATKLKGATPVVLASDFISTKTETEEEKKRGRVRENFDNQFRDLIKKQGFSLIGIGKGARANFRKMGHAGQYYNDNVYEYFASKICMPQIRDQLVKAGKWKFDFSRGIGGTPQDSVYYLGGEGDLTLNTVRRLSNGKILIGGGASNLDWVPAGVPVTELKGAKPESAETGMVPFVILFAKDMQSIESVVTLPRDSAEAITRIRDTGIPTQATGDIYIGGPRKGRKENKTQGIKKISGGFFIARLDGNFVDQPPTSVVWCENVAASGREAWDVNSKGECVYVAGGPHGWNWYEVVAIGSDGKRIVVENWQHHWYEDAEGKRQVWKGKASEVPGKIWYSAFIFKNAYHGGSVFRSWSKEDFLAKTSDGNGGEKMGKWPFDAMFPGYWDPKTEKQVIVLEGVWDAKKQKTVPATKDKKGRLRKREHGYYGYKMADLSCEINSVLFDRRNDCLYLGGCNKSHMGQPDFEPWVVAFDPTGKLRWWQRLYAESKGISTPDQYVDNLVIDFHRPQGEGGLIVTARAHGNNVNNFYRPDELVHPKSSKKGFQSKFTGTHGNMHYRWLGRLTLDGGEVVDCTYMAEYAEQDASKHGSGRFGNPLLKEWPNWNSGWPDLNTTGIGNDSVSVDKQGNIYLCGIGRRPITTNNAFMQMPSPVAAKGSVGYWSEFARVYTPNFNTLLYSTILCGPWDWYTGHGRSENNLADCLPTEDGIIVIGTSSVDKKTGKVKGNDMPTRNVPAWGQKTRSGRMGVIAILKYK